MLRIAFVAALFCALSSPSHARNHHKSPSVSRHVTHVVKHRANLRPSSESVIGSYDLVAKARAYLGQTARQVGVRTTLWCSAFLRKLTGANGVDDRARSWLRKPHVPGQVGAIAVLSRGGKGAGHVGIVSGFDRHGNPRIVSGNHGHKVGEAVYPARRVLAYVSL